MIKLGIFKNPELVYLRNICFIIFCFLLVGSLGVAWLGVSRVQKIVETEKAAIVGAVLANYPAAEEDVILQITNPKPQLTELGQSLLQRYGVNISDLNYRPNFSTNLFWLQLSILITFLVLGLGAFMWLGQRFFTRHYQQLQMITDYTRQIENGNYNLDIRDNNEGELSILKNELYKITIRLREQAKESEKHRLLLANSIADISHQLKTPITSLYVIHDLLEHQPALAVKNKFLPKMQTQLRRMEWLISSLLKLSKLDAGTVVMKKETVVVAKLVSAVLKSLEIPIEIKAQEIVLNALEDVSYLGDFVWSKEALINIVKNAITNTPAGGKIVISYSENPLFTEIVVADNGVGIDKKDLPYIFNRFYQGKNSGEESVGVGLAITKAIIEKHGGTIGVKSVVGQGSEFVTRFYKQYDENVI